MFHQHFYNFFFTVRKVDQTWSVTVQQQKAQICGEHNFRRIKSQRIVLNVLFYSSGSENSYTQTDITL